MGNIGNLNCDQKTHVSKDRPHIGPWNPSRIQRDLSDSLHQNDYMENIDSTASPMIRRAVGKIPHVCIVGAGVAGLRCADILLQHGAKVTILEGRNRVGGRVCLFRNQREKQRRTTDDNSYVKVTRLDIWLICKTLLISDSRRVRCKGV
jgi:succinate dehydrogenase/fumarate reductase flavoprotein subunit